MGENGSRLFLGDLDDGSATTDLNLATQLGREILIWQASFAGAKMACHLAQRLLALMMSQ